MLEGIIIISFYMAIRFMPLRGKTYDMLNDMEKAKLIKAYDQYKRTVKGKNDLNSTLETYLPTLQKQGLTALIAGIIGFIVWVFVLIFVYPIFFS